MSGNFPAETNKSLSDYGRRQMQKFRASHSVLDMWKRTTG